MALKRAGLIKNDLRRRLQAGTGSRRILSSIVRKESAVEAKDGFEIERGGAEAIGTRSVGSLDSAETVLRVAMLEARFLFEIL